MFYQDHFRFHQGHNNGITGYSEGVDSNGHFIITGRIGLGEVSSMLEWQVTLVTCNLSMITFQA